MNDCIFCKIIKEEIPCNKIYEDNNIIAFLDIAPVNPGHTLVVPKKHSINMLDTPEETLKELIAITKKLLPAIEAATNAKGFNIHINNNEIAGQAVHHIHLHIIPRFKNDGRKLWKGSEYKGNEAEILTKSISSNL
ncbi:MAG: HIT family protein [Nanoarchaeota archaeon]|nr:HIT family protein [Nanoarchaeota archaeon]